MCRNGSMQILKRKYCFCLHQCSIQCPLSLSAMTSRTDFVLCNSAMADLERGVKNRWCWDWLECDRNWEKFSSSFKTIFNKMKLTIHVQVSKEGKKWEFSPVFFILQLLPRTSGSVSRPLQCVFSCVVISGPSFLCHDTQCSHCGSGCC